MFTFPRTEVNFSYTQRDENGNVVATVERTVTDDNAEYLPTILEAFMYFLQGMTFTYIDNVIATSETGTEHSAVEI